MNEARGPWSWAETAPDMLAALKAVCGHMMNAKIDLATGTKKTAIRTIDAGLVIARAAIEAAERKP